jgi:PKD repeat protein
MPARYVRLIALAIIAYACTSEHSPTAPLEPSSPEFATAATVVARPGGPYTGLEGATITFDGSASSGAGLTYDWDFGDGTPHGTGVAPTHVYVDNKKYNVRLIVTDAVGTKSKAVTTTATIANALPVLEALVSPTPAPRVSVASTYRTTFTDAGTIDRHTGTFTWGDGTASTAATIAEANGSGSASAAHTYTTAGTYTVSLRVADNNGGADTVKLSVVVLPPNRAPVARAGGPYSGVEGSSIAFNGSASSDPDGDALTYDWDFGDGTAHDATVTPTHVYADNGSFTVRLVVTDANGLKSAVSQTTATVSNATPTVTSFSARTPAGGSQTVDASFSDVGTRDTHTATVDWGDSKTSTGSVQESGGSGTVTASHTYAVSGSYSVTMRITDNAGAVATATVDVSVDVPPPTASAGGPYGGTEGQAVQFDGSGSVSPNGLSLSYDWDFGDGSAHGSGQNPSHTYADNATYTVTLVVTEVGGASSQPSQTTATIGNAAPVLGPLSGPSGTPGVALTVSGNFTDAGTRDTHSAAFDWGDGSSDAAAISESNGAGTASGTHTYASVGSYTVTLTLSDNDGSSSVRTVTLSVLAGNTAPVASAGGPYAAAEGSAITFDGSASGDPDGDVITYDWDFGDGTAHGVGSAPQHTYADNGGYTVTLVVTDSRGASSAPSQTTATISNATPVLGPLSGPSSGTAGVALTFSGNFSDAGARDTHSGAFDWGDGSSNAAAISESNGAGTASGTHTYAAAGSYTVTLTLSDNDGSSSTATVALTVTVNNPPVANAGGPYAGGEGGTITFNGSASRDPDGDVITYDWNFGDGTAHGVGVAPKHAYLNNGSYVVTLVVTDSRGASSAPSQTTATISNAIPVITLTRGPAAPFPVDHPFAVSATFTDGAGVVDQHVASIAWGDGSTTSPARLYDSTTSTGKGWGALGGVHTYSAPGTYTATITVRDKDGGTATSDLTLTATPAGSSQVLLTAGDIALCTATGDRQTSLLLDQFAGWVQTLGDNAYPNGTDTDFMNCYDPADSWGKQKDRTHPAPGNHEYYGTADAAGYFNYFGAAAGNRGQGYYSYNLGAWHIVVANAEIPVGLNTPQNLWLRNDLASNTLACTAVVVHEPLFSSDPTGPSSKARPIWDAAYQYHVTLMLSGHAHEYERFAPQTPTGAADPVNGIRQFVVGTGGDGNISRAGTIMPNSEVMYFASFGILKLTLDPGSYTWQFVPTTGTFTDGGTAACH